MSVGASLVTSEVTDQSLTFFKVDGRNTNTGKEVVYTNPTCSPTNMVNTNRTVASQALKHMLKSQGGCYPWLEVTNKQASPGLFCSPSSRVRCLRA